VYVISNINQYVRENATGLSYVLIAMNHAKSLRVIGQALEVAKVSMFNLESDGRNYMVQSDSMSRTGEWMLRYAVTESDFSTLSSRRSTADTALKPNSVELKPVVFNNADIARLDARETKRRRDRRDISSSQAELSTNLSQLLRTLGDHLDRSSARTFHIFWMPDSIVVDYRRADGLTDRQRFTPEKLLQFNNSGLRRARIDHKNN
jgi:hypothetical protein